SYGQFKRGIEIIGVPEVISFDHDLADEHYPPVFSYSQPPICYEDYKERTGYDCAKLLVERGEFPRLTIVHSFNTAGAQNIAHLLASYTAVIVCPWRVENYSPSVIARWQQSRQN